MLRMIASMSFFPVALCGIGLGTITILHSKNSTNIPASITMRQTAKISGYSANPGEFMDMWVLKKIPILLPRSSSKVALQALATLEVPIENQPVKQDGTVRDRI